MVSGESTKTTRNNGNPNPVAPMLWPGICSHPLPTTRNRFHHVSSSPTAMTSSSSYHPDFDPPVDSTCHPFRVTNNAPPASGTTSERARSLLDSVISPFLTCVKPSAEYPTNVPPTARVSATWTAREPHPVSPHYAVASPSSSSQKSGATTSGRTQQHASLVPHNLQLREGHSFLISAASSSDGASSFSGSSASPPVTIWQPCENDVLCGRGGGSGNTHRGNARFRQLVESQRVYYGSLTKKQKMMLARLIVELVRQVGGRFLARDTQSGGWYDVGLARSLEKTCQALREKPQTSSGDTNSREPDSSSSSSQSSQDTSTASPTYSEVTARMRNSNRNLVSSVPRLILPAHLQELYAPALAHLTATQVSTHHHHQPFVRPVPHPMPSHDFHYRYDRPASAPPVHHRGETPTSSQILSGMFRPPSSLLPRPNSPESNISFGSSAQQQNKQPLGNAYPIPKSPQRPSPHPLQPPPSSHDNENIPPSNAATTSTTSTTTSPLRQQIWKKARTQPNVENKTSSVVETLPFLSGRSTGGALWPPPVESKLSLQERVIRAPSRPLVPPSRVAGRSKSHHADTAESSEQDDGLAALSTAAFLRLDEESAD